MRCVLSIFNKVDAILVDIDSRWWHHHGGSVTWPMTSPVDESHGVSDVRVLNAAFAHDVQSFDAVLRQPARRTPHSQW